MAGKDIVPCRGLGLNNVRDVMKYLVETGVVERVKMRKKKHPRYDLTDLGLEFQKLLLGVRVPLPQTHSAKSIECPRSRWPQE